MVNQTQIKKLSKIKNKTGAVDKNNGKTNPFANEKLKTANNKNQESDDSQPPINLVEDESQGSPKEVKETKEAKNLVPHQDISMTKNSNLTHLKIKEFKFDGAATSEYLGLNYVGPYQTIVTAILSSQISNQHKMSLGSIESDFSSKSDSFSVTLSKQLGFIGIGLAIREICLENQLIFMKQNKEDNMHFNHGCFLISSNGFSWNCNMLSENNLKLPRISNQDVKLVEKDKIRIIYNHNTESLRFIRADKLLKELSNVRAPLGKHLVPCVILLRDGDLLCCDLDK